MATELWAIGLVLLASFCGSMGPVFLKVGSHRLTRDFKKLVLNYPIYIGIGFYGLGTVLFVPALRGGELSVLYPIVATTYIWVSFWSMLFLKEKMNSWKWAGIVAIIIGVTCIGIGSS